MVADFVGGKDVEAVRVEKMDRATSICGRVAILQEVVGHVRVRGTGHLARMVDTENKFRAP